MSTSRLVASHTYVFVLPSAVVCWYLHSPSSPVLSCGRKAMHCDG